MIAVTKGLPCVNRYPTELEEHFKTTVIPQLLFLMNDDDDKKVRGAAVESFDDLVKALGPAFVDRNMPALTEGIMRLLEADMDEDLSGEEEGEAEEEDD